MSEYYFLGTQNTWNSVLGQIYEKTFAFFQFYAMYYHMLFKLQKCAILLLWNKFIVNQLQIKINENL